MLIVKVLKMVRSCIYCLPLYGQPIECMSPLIPVPSNVFEQLFKTRQMIPKSNIREKIQKSCKHVDHYHVRQ